MIIGYFKIIYVIDLNYFIFNFHLKNDEIATCFNFLHFIRTNISIKIQIFQIYSIILIEV